MASSLQGRGVSAGLVCAPVLQLVVPASSGARSTPPPDDGTPEQRRGRVVEALDAVARDMEQRLATAPTAAAEVLQMTAQLARDPSLETAVAGHLDQGLDAEAALSAAVEDYCSQLESLGGYLAERTTDLRDVRDRATAHLRGEQAPVVPTPGHPFVLAARDLAPADTATLDGSDVVGIVTDEGGPTSHTAILARSLGLPAVVGCAGATGIADGTVVVLDGTSGVVELDVDDDRRAAVEQLQRNASGPASTGTGRTRDGHAVALLANVGTLADAERAAGVENEGVGLFRTEFLFLDRTERPDVDEQTAIYERVLQHFDGKPVTVRTLDAGSDKPIAYLPLEPEENPALGIRGLRVARVEPTHLAEQLEALARARRSTGARLKVMAPMVSTPDEARDFVATARAAGLADVGVMVEVPAAALRATHLLAEVDFASIGTNDLSQYTFAADRLLAGVGDLLDPWQPALLDLVAAVAAAGRAADKPVGVCGEAASDPQLAVVLVGLGVSTLSMAAPALRGVRDQLAQVDLARCEQAADLARAARSAADARTAVLDLLRQ
ncbi:phosphoenolpyruvate--protein phosphotransferase [Angustibacter peucedani]